jgi:hypothetical protein
MEANPKVSIDELPMRLRRVDLIQSERENTDEESRYARGQPSLASCDRRLRHDRETDTGLCRTGRYVPGRYLCAKWRQAGPRHGQLQGVALQQAEHQGAKLPGLVCHLPQQAGAWRVARRAARDLRSAEGEVRRRQRLLRVQ